MMKSPKSLLALALMIGLLSIGIGARAADGQKDSKPAKVVPYPLKTCLVTDEKFGGDMGDPYVITNGTHEIKFCCKGCVKDFNKDTAKHLKKLEAAEKKGK